MTNSRSLPFVSIGLPVYNGARYLARALDALLAQEDVELEVLVSDNGSTDDSGAIAESYAARDPRVRVFRSAVNRGVEANFMRVLGEASAPYFMWAACDDWWAPRFAAALVDALESTPGAVVAMSAVERVDESGRVHDLVRFAGRLDPARLSPFHLTMRLASGWPYHLFVYGMYRTAFVRQAFTGFAPVIAADRLFMCRVAMAGRYAAVHDVLHRRLVRAAPIAERYADESIGRLWQGSRPRWRLALYAAPYLWRSPVLGLARRLWSPLVALRFLMAGLSHTLVQAGWLRRRPLPAPR